MSRHRNVRSMNYSEEYEGYDDVYGHSVEDDYTISPSDAAFMYDRTNKPQMSAFFTEDDIAEEDENVEVSEGKRCSEPDVSKLTKLNEEDRLRLQSCLDEIRNVIGDSIPEPTVIKKILAYDFDVNKTLDAVLSEATANTQSKSEDFRPAEPAPCTDKDDKTTALHNIEECLKDFKLSREVDEMSSTKPSLSECSLKDLASSFSGKDTSFVSDFRPPGFDIPVLNQDVKGQIGHSNFKDCLGLKLPSFDSPFFNPLVTPGASSQTGSSSQTDGLGLKLPSFDAPISNPLVTPGASSQTGSSSQTDGLGLKLPSFDAPISNPFGTQGSLSRTGSSSQTDGLGLKLPSFDAPIAKPSESETSYQTGLSLSDLASMHLNSRLACNEPEINFGGNEEPLSLSALAAQHQSKMKSGHENTSLSLLAAEHLRNAVDTSQGFFIPRLSSPPDKSVRSFSPVFRGESPVEVNSDPIDLLGALNPPENRTKLEHPRVTWMEEEDDEVEEEFILTDPTCLLDCATQGTLMDIDSNLSTDQSSPLGRILCERFISKHTFSFDIAARYEGNLKRFLFDCPSPDDNILIRLGRKLPSEISSAVLN